MKVIHTLILYNANLLVYTTSMRTIKETSKALLITDEVNVAWIQKKWLRANGSLTPAGQKALEEGKTLAQFEKEQSDFEKKTVRIFTVKAKETEKAVAFELMTIHPLTGDVVEKIAFLPKSMMTPEGEFPKWIVNKKIEEMNNYFTGANFFLSRV
jgi:hypothetical protein